MAKATPVVVTGSLLPQKIKADQRIAPTAFNLTIIDQKTIQTSGAADLARVLRRSVAGVR